jgi:hypothetical protein
MARRPVTGQMPGGVGDSHVALVDAVPLADA